MDWLKGKKSYILAGLAVIYAASGFLTGHLSGPQALDVLFAAGGLATLRAGIVNTIQKFADEANSEQK
jgi:hypothetical protein